MKIIYIITSGDKFHSTRKRGARACNRAFNLVDRRWSLILTYFANPCVIYGDHEGEEIYFKIFLSVSERLIIIAEKIVCLNFLEQCLSIFTATKEKEWGEFSL